MSVGLLPQTRATVETLYRATVKTVLSEGQATALSLPPDGRFARQCVLPPCLGEMGMEIRHNLSLAEPFLRNGWKIVTRRPAFYPTGTTIDAPELLAEIDQVLQKFGIVSSGGGMHIPPGNFGVYSVRLMPCEPPRSVIELDFSDIQKVTRQALAEIELRRLFAAWFYFDGRPLTEYDRRTLSFAATTEGNIEYHLASAQRPSYLPPGFENPLEDVSPHVGVQIRKVANGVPQDRNSDCAWMLLKARELAAHLKLDLIVYGHPGGCHIPTGYRTSYDPARTDDQMTRELGYLKSCRFMLSPNSGWADLMAWLEIPTLIEPLVPDPDVFEPLRYGFRPKILFADTHASICEQADALLSATGVVLPRSPVVSSTRYDSFVWEP